MDNKHKMIKGYRDLSQEEIDLMNKIKTHAKVLGELVKEVQAHLSKTCTYVTKETCIEDRGFATIGEGPTAWTMRQGSWSYGPDENTARWQSAQPYKWLDRAKDDLQDGFMKLTRAVAQPTTF